MSKLRATLLGMLIVIDCIFVLIAQGLKTVTTNKLALLQLENSDMSHILYKTSSNYSYQTGLTILAIVNLLVILYIIKRGLKK